MSAGTGPTTIFNTVLFGKRNYPSKVIIFLETELAEPIQQAYKSDN
jgi:hypothetical protein